MSPLQYPIQYPHPHQYYLNTTPQPIKPTQHQFSHPHDILYRLASSGLDFIPNPSMLPPSPPTLQLLLLRPHLALSSPTPNPTVFSHPVHVMRPPHPHHLHPAQLGGLGLGPFHASY
ncbi:hypothetical protein SLA2020_378410 [Shorea laevis]